MCVLAFAWAAHPRWRLLMAGNRDELHARPAAPLARWETPRHLIAGRDLKSKGTWAGVSNEGRFAVVTNLRGFGVPQADRASRGALVTDILAGEGRYAVPSDDDLADFNPFNLIVTDAKGAYFLSNRPEPIRANLSSGLYGLSNGALDEPWPKTLRVKAMLLDWIVGGAADPDRLLDGLREDGTMASGLPALARSDVPQEPPLSTVFIRNPVYGTRCSTVVAIDSDGHGMIIERRYDPTGETTGETELRLDWPA